MARKTARFSSGYGSAVGFLCLTLVSLPTGCTRIIAEGPVPAQEVLSEGIGALEDRYIEPIRPGRMVMSGLTQLASIDDSITVTQESKSVVVRQDGFPVVERPIPASDNIDEWSALGARVILDTKREVLAFSAYGEDELLDFVFQGLVSGLDRYSRYLTPDDARNSRASREGFGGIGIQIEEVDGDFIVRTTLPDHPAVDAGVRANDRITHIDGHPINGLSLFDVVKKLRGKVGDPVKVTLLRTGVVKPFDRRIVRDYIVASTVKVSQRDKILEVQLSGFNTGTVGELRRAIVKTARTIGPDVQGIVLDLRSNPGGLLDQAIAVSDLFLTKGRIISTKGRHPDSNQFFDASPGEVLPGVPIVVIVNGRSASAAEIVAVALRDAGRAAIVGSSSFGKGSVQTITRLPNKGELNITWARIFAPSGQTLDLQGIVPAICTNVPAKRMIRTLAILSSESKDSALNRTRMRLEARQPHYSAERRRMCPPTNRREAHDLETARLLLKDRISYTAATSRLEPTVAKRLPNNSGSPLE